MIDIEEMSEELTQVHHSIVELHLDDDLNVITAEDIADWADLDLATVRERLEELAENDIIELDERGRVTSFDHLGYSPYQNSVGGKWYDG